jgi:hypothetical protein
MAMYNVAQPFWTQHDNLVLKSSRFVVDGKRVANA